MAMNVKQGDGGHADPMIEINTTPLIDVMLVLLIMLIITIPVQMHATKLNMPRPNVNPPPTDPVVVDLEIDFDGTILWNHNVVTSERQLLNFLKQSAEADPQPEVHLRPNRLAHYSTVARVLADAQRLNVTKIGFVGNEQYQ